MRGSIAGIVVLAGLVVGAASAEGKETPREAGERLIVDGRPVEAATAFGKALAAAMKAEDLEEQEALADLIEDRLESAADRAGATRDVLAALAAELPAGESYGYVSAPALAMELLFRAIEAGDDRHLAKAAQILAACARHRSSGRAADALDALAKGTVAARKGETETAGKELAKALDAAVRESWTRLALHAAAEMAALDLANEDPDKAAAAVAAAAQTLSRKADADWLALWARLVKARLTDAPRDVLAPMKEAEESLRGLGSRAGQSGGAGADAGAAPPVSPLGQAWPKLKSDAPFASIRRLEKGFEVKFLFEVDAVRMVERQPGLAYAEHGGVVLSFHDYEVGLREVDLRGRAAAPGAGAPGGPFRALLPLGVGETWSVAKSGRTTIKSK